jgi:protein TonB
VDHALPRSALALFVATCVHVGAFAWAAASGSTLAAWSAQLAARLHEEVARERVVELTPPPPPPKPPAATEPPPPRQKLARAIRPVQPRADSRPPPPAQAGRIIAQDEASRTPLDLTGNTFVTGTAQAYAGGVTSPTGTNPNPVESRDVDPKAPPGEPDRSRRVALVEEGCHTWPAEAEAEPIDHQDVRMRIVVGADGAVVSARVLGDPGHGFGAAAVECARRSRFSPELDATGRPVQVEVPFRWHFTR